MIETTRSRVFTNFCREKLWENSSFHGRIDLQRIHSQIRNEIISNSLPPPKERHNKLQDVCFVFHHTTPTCSPPPNLFLELLNFPSPSQNTPQTPSKTRCQGTKPRWHTTKRSLLQHRSRRISRKSTAVCIAFVPRLPWLLGKVAISLEGGGWKNTIVPRAQRKKTERATRTYNIYVWQRCLLQSFSGCWKILKHGTSEEFAMIGFKKHNHWTMGFSHAHMFKSGDFGRDESIRPAFWVRSEQLKKHGHGQQHHSKISTSFSFSGSQNCLVSHYLLLTIWNMFVVWSISESSQSIQCNNQAAVTIESILLQPSQK